MQPFPTQHKSTITDIQWLPRTSDSVSSTASSSRPPHRVLWCRRLRRKARSPGSLSQRCSSTKSPSYPRKTMSFSGNCKAKPVRCANDAPTTTLSVRSSSPNHFPPAYFRRTTMASETTSLASSRTSLTSVNSDHLPYLPPAPSAGSSTVLCRPREYGLIPRA